MTCTSWEEAYWGDYGLG